MRTLGLIGGMSWESTLEYYRLVNAETRARLGGLHSAPLVLWSVDFAYLRRALRRGGERHLAGPVRRDHRAPRRRRGRRVVLGCTEIELLVDSGDTTVPLFPLTALHVRRAVDVVLA